MTTTVTLPEGFFYLAPAFASTVFLLIGQSVIVGRRRKAANIEYPQLYAEKKEADASKDAYIFNCAQRAHQNTLEHIPVIYTITLLTGLKYPVFAASALGFWTLSRFSYTRGYITGDPKKRGTFLFRAGMLTEVALLGASTYISGSWLLEGLSAKFF